MGDHHWKGATAVAFALLLCVVIFSGCAGWLSSTDTLASPTPVINTAAAPDTATPETDADVTFSVSAVDPQNQALTYTWSDNGAGGTFTGTGSTVTWSNATAGNYTITVTVADPDGNSVDSTFAIEVVAPGTVVHTVAGQSGYVGKDTCMGCHSGVIDIAQFDHHRHNHKLNPGTSEFIGAWWTGSNLFDTINYDFGIDGERYFATIDGVEHDIVRTLGWGFEKWKQRYIVKVGNSWYITPAQHNMLDDEWVDYHVGDWADGMPTGTANSYDRRCMGCHTTGGNVEYFDDTQEWVMGVSEENVQCEACHGPGEVHAGSMNAADITNPITDIADYDRKLEVCGNCHGRGNSVMELGGSTMGYPFSADGKNFRPGDNIDDFYVQNPGLWPDGHSKKHHQQYLDYKLSAHYAGGSMLCTTCHNVHEPDADYTNATCTGCHGSVGADLAAHTQHASELQCIDCHMPYLAKSAFAYDIRSHAFDIISPQTSMDNFLADPTNVMPNSCMNGGCHGGPGALADEALIQAKLDDYNAMWPSVHTVAGQTGYVGKDTCMNCHSGVIDIALFDNHRHNHKLNPGTSEFIGAWWTGSHAFDTINYDFGIDGERYFATIDGVEHDIVRTLGWGFEKWKQRYIVKVGNSWYITPAQHNMLDDEWVDYHVGDWDAGMPTGTANSYDRRCMGCHTTGGNVEYFDDTQEWVMGVSEENVQCEACHGPGETHAGSMNAADITNPITDIADYDRKLEVCGNCHGRGNSVMELGGSTMGYPFSADGKNFRPGDNIDDFYVQNPGLWPDGHSKKHHQQYLDYKLSAHYAGGSMLCTQCHNVHEPDADYDNTWCTSCHGGIGADLNAHTMHATEKQCIDCHMPYTAKSAFAYDIRSHAFDIITPQVSMDNFIADPTNVIPNSCMNGGCHGGPDALADEALIQAKLDDYNALWPGL